MNDESGESDSQELEIAFASDVSEQFIRDWKIWAIIGLIAVIVGAVFFVRYWYVIDSVRPYLTAEDVWNVIQILFCLFGLCISAMLALLSGMAFLFKRVPCVGNLLTNLHDSLETIFGIFRW